LIPIQFTTLFSRLRIAGLPWDIQMHMRKTLVWFAMLLLSAAAVALCSLPSPGRNPDLAALSFWFNYEVHVPPTKDIQGKMLPWLPLPKGP
jgi:hypothetical protein